jgi:dGTPase
MCYHKMDWQRLLAPKRFRYSHEDRCQSQGEGSSYQNGRTQFQRDLDRITFSNSFRRLGRKTQVHLLTDNDHIHTRLSHSLEVACVGRSLGVEVGHWLEANQKESLPRAFQGSTVGEIVQAACLAHDIGNPPYGHAAEQAIGEWFKENLGIETKWNELFRPGQITDLRCFDGNAMAFRVVAYKEFYVGRGGMRLTYPTLGAILKYPWTSHFAECHSNKFSCFQTEYDLLCEVANELGLTEKNRDGKECKVEYARHPLAYLVEAADDICYRVLDIEDAIELRLLPEDMLCKRLGRLVDRYLTDEDGQLLNDTSASPTSKNGLIRGKMINRMIAEIVKAFTEHYETIIEGRFDGSLFDKTSGDSVCLAVRDLYEREKLRPRIYQNQQNVPLELGVYNAVRTLLDTSLEAAQEIVDGGKMSHKTQIIQRFFKYNHNSQTGGKDLYQILMLFLDYITGMTDEFATFMNKQLLGLGN